MVERWATDRPPPTTAESARLGRRQESRSVFPQGAWGPAPGSGPASRLLLESPLRYSVGAFLLLYFSNFMPKMKTHSGAKKRFKVTGTGKVRGRSAFTSHILEKKSPKRKRRHGQPAVISKADVPRVKKLLGVGK
ncbi:MAG: ribosomal protein [Solirubrobacterales bacterium]|nr:ribosomal protein [Solirubrobacterales bacterium]